ncbi:MAG: hypothetical protein M3Z08_01510 [Chloroflexota bacterium]|nr:hypothetical protein [Chloroflexota bacterium]
MVGSAAEYEKVAPPQPELPAWLESLRASERSAAPGSGQAGFLAADLVEEGNLPSWMRSERGADTAENAFPGAQSGWRPAPSPLPDTGNSFPLPPDQGIIAHSLIDEGSLPSWMRENQTGGEVRQGDPFQPGQRSISASSLVQPDALPDWMKSLQPQQSPAPAFPPAPTPSPSPAPPYMPLNEPGMPPYMQFNEPSMPPVQSAALSAHDLIDPQKLPAWMIGNEGSAGSPDRHDQVGLNASSLLDMHSLPPWLREGSLGQNTAPPASQVQPYVHPTPQSGLGGDLAAGSLIDMNALPEWLRASAEPQSGSGQGMSSNQRQGPYGAPPRVDNVRVPSRPRGEMGPHEQSEAAANVFASMLGVASAAPYVPEQPTHDAYGRPFQPPPEQPTQAPLGMGLPPQGMQPLGMPPQGMPPMGTPPGFAGPPPSPSYPGVGGYPMGNQPGGLPPYQMGMSQEPAWMGQGQAQSQTKPAKRSFLDAIRDWFSR